MPHPPVSGPFEPDMYRHFSLNSVRDMAWLLFSPKVFHHTLGHYPAFDLQLNTDVVLIWLEEQERRLSNGKSQFPLRKDFRRLGLYCEALLHYFFMESRTQHLCPFTMQSHNLQIFKGGNTLGELDLFLEDHQSNFFHVEIAVKFYLQSRSSGSNQECSRWDNWIGPNSIDRLDIKCDRMITHQLSLIENHPNEFIEACNDGELKKKLRHSFQQGEYTQQSIKASHFFKGINFIHFLSMDHAVRPISSNEHSPLGAWGRLSELKNHASELARVFPCEQTYLVDKMGWMTGDNDALLKKSFTDSLNDVEALFHQAKSRGYPTPGCMIFFEDKETETKDGEALQTGTSSPETQKAPLRRPFVNRIIVVGDNWPSQN